MKNNKSRKNHSKNRQNGKTVFMSHPIGENSPNKSALKKVASNKYTIYIAIVVLVVIVAVLVAVFVRSSGNNVEPDPSEEIETASPSPSPSPTPAITPPAVDGDPASGSDIIMEPEVRPVTDSDLVSINPEPDPS